MQKSKLIESFYQVMGPGTCPCIFEVKPKKVCEEKVFAQV